MTILASYSPPTRSGAAGRPVLDDILAVALADRRMTRRAGKTRMNPFECESGIAVVIKPVGRPVLGCIVTSLAVLFSVPRELAAVYIGMARVTGSRRAAVHTDSPGCAVGRFLLLLSMAVCARRVLVSVCQGVAGPAGVVVGPDGKRVRVPRMTSRTVAFRHLALELPSVRIGMTSLAVARGGGEAADRRAFRHGVATDTGNSGVRTGQRIDIRVLCDVIAGRQESLWLVAVAAVGMTGGELARVRVLMAALTQVRMSLIVGRLWIGIALIVSKPGGVALLAGHCRMCLTQRETRQAMILRLNAPRAFGPGLI